MQTLALNPDKDVDSPIEFIVNIISKGVFEIGFRDVLEKQSRKTFHILSTYSWSKKYPTTPF